MTDKTMPKEVWCGMDNASECGGEWEAYAKPYAAYSAKYVRADLVQGDPDEPLAVGQTRWVRMYHGERWRAAEIGKSEVYDRLTYTICGEEDLAEHVEDCYEWGPVIQPPENA